MKTLLVLVILGAIAWYGYGKYKSMDPGVATDTASVAAISPATPAPASATAKFSCDGRTRCPQMHSCEEATYFIQHCPNTKMDGDHDGVPCERQWCN